MACASICRETLDQNSIFKRVVSHFQENVGSIGVVSGEHMIGVVTQSNLKWANMNY